MELILSSVVVPWAVSLIGLALATLMIAALFTLVLYGGVYYAVPRWIVKFLGHTALNRIS
jgi:NADH:ubiquinone oxidoreductase subunit 3 (subunit A)